MYAISDTITLPAALEFDVKGGRWWFSCVVCGSWTSRKNRWTLAGVHVCSECATEHNETAAQLQAEYQGRKDRERREVINAMQGHCDTGTPDSDTSPGANWLYWLHNAVTEAWDSGRFGLDSGEDETDVLSEISDSLTPVYTHNRWQIFTDLCAYETDVDDFSDGVLVKDSSDLLDLAGSIMGEIAYRGAANWLNEKRENSKCDECSEFPCECCEDCALCFCECDVIAE